VRFVTVGNGRVYEVPDTWAEAEDMLIKGQRYHDGRGGNIAQQSIAMRVAYGMFADKWMAADPTQAMMFLMQRICQLKGAGLVP
jgi:hypothetical protein